MQQGQLIGGRYRLRAVIGSGGMGQVWLARDEQTGTEVALKCGGTGRAAYRGVRAMEAASKLNNANVVRLLGVVEDDGFVWLVMEYVRSASLDRLLEKQHRLPVQQVAALGAQLASALAAVHTLGVVHQDVKPGNILITSDGVAKLTDFGIARVSWGDPTLTNEGGGIGTPAYMSPEVAEGGKATAESDIFSLGATLFAAVEGERIYGTEDNPLKILRTAMRREIAPPRLAGPLATALIEMLSITPSDRPTAAQAERMLAEVADGAPAPAAPEKLLTVAGGDRARPRGWLSSRTGRTVGIAAVALVVVAVLGLVFLPRLWPQPETPSAASPKPTAAGAGTVGDQRTADPCSLLNRMSYDSYGRTELNNAQGNFNRCDVIVHPPNQPAIDLHVDLESDPPSQVAGMTVAKVGKVTAYRYVMDDGDCERAIAMADHTTAFLTVDAKGNARPDACKIADLMLRDALAVIDRGPLARRPVPIQRASLGRLDACAIMPTSALSNLLGVTLRQDYRGFGGWHCEWITQVGHVTLTVAYDHGQDLGDGKPYKAGRRDAAVQPNADDDHMCQVNLGYRKTTDQNGDDTLEIMQIKLSKDDVAGDKLCPAAQQVATAISARV
ncbi:serine/threonine-protein kinase [Fodinicola acaciae]|uniref:serine/threonine-protein kinase n=1 Tax=Fodinicola acaciae TaxID=2681555 RepID=UPI0013D2381E|nr:serine/threonine-protein kinase [Fodinicola acaciae]